MGMGGHHSSCKMERSISRTIKLPRFALNGKTFSLPGIPVPELPRTMYVGSSSEPSRSIMTPEVVY